MICIFLTAATFTALWQVNHCDFTNYDDNNYITGNSYIQNGITIEGIQWAFTTSHASNWHPLTWLSHMLDIQLFGLKPQWHHLTNLLFHIVNTLLLFLVFYRMTKALWQSAFVAALFALHPLHVESVAWIAERKDVISTFFWMLTMGAYVSYVDHPVPQRYLAVLIFFVLGLMAKPMLVTLPFVLLLLDYWPLKRFEKKKSAQENQSEVEDAVFWDKLKENPEENHNVEMKGEEPAYSKYQWALIRPLLWEKIPLFALTALSSTVTYVAQQKGSATVSFEALHLSVRIANAFVSYIIYIGKMICPNNLAVFYPHPVLWPLWQVVGAAVLLAVITMAAAWKMKHFPYLMVGWLWYIGTLIPVIGIVQVGAQARADRYTYIPLIGLFIMAVWGIPELLKKWRYREDGLFAASALTISCLFIVTWIQVGYWQNSIILFEHALKVTDNNYVAYNGRGASYAGIGNYRQAIEDFNRAIEINPKYVDAYCNRGITHGSFGNYNLAIEDFDRAIEINPKYAEAYCKRGAVYGILGNHNLAIGNFDKAIEINPKYAEAYNNRGIAYNSLGNSRQAIEDWKTAARLGKKVAHNFFRK